VRDAGSETRDRQREREQMLDHQLELTLPVARLAA